jgi:hypothetical protein
MIGTLVGSDSSNMFFMAINTSVDFPGQLNKRGAPAGVVISNGMYSIDINVDIDASEEILPSGASSRPFDINQALAIYAELTGCELQVDEEVRQFAGLMQFPQNPEMTRTQACEFFEATLLEQAGLEITKPDNNHAILRFRTKPQP